MKRLWSRFAEAAGKDARAAPRSVDRRPNFKTPNAGAVLPAIAGCSTLERGAAVPGPLADHVTVLGIPNARFWPDTQGTAMAQEAIAAQARERQYAATGTAGRLPPAYFLAVSGGSDSGAFG